MKANAVVTKCYSTLFSVKIRILTEIVTVAKKWLVNSFN